MLAILIILFRGVVAIYIAALFRPFSGADIFIDPGYLVHREPFAKMYHPGSIKKRIFRELL